MSDTRAPTPTPDPVATLRPDARGTPALLGSSVWLLADYVPRPEPVWDVIYDAVMLDADLGSEPDAVRAAAARLLFACHDLTPEQIADLIVAADVEALIPAVLLALFGPAETYRTWSRWARSSCWAAGVDPDRVPAAELRDVLEVLVATGRALPASEWVSSAQAASTKADLLALATPRPQ